MRIDMAKTDADYLDTAETDALVAALQRRSPSLVVVMVRPGSPDDGADRFSVYFETRSCCAVHNCINAQHMLYAAGAQILERLDQHLDAPKPPHPNDEEGDEGSGPIESTFDDPPQD